MVKNWKFRNLKLNKMSFRLDFQSRKSLTIKCVASIYDVYYKEVKLTIRKLREV